LELYSRRFWKAISDCHRQVHRAAAKCQACFQRLEIGRAMLTEDAQYELLLEYVFAAAELREALAQLRTFQNNQRTTSRRRIQGRVQTEAT
jgi:hypothetical protein